MQGILARGAVHARLAVSGLRAKRVAAELTPDGKAARLGSWRQAGLTPGALAPSLCDASRMRRGADRLGCVWDTVVAQAFWGACPVPSAGICSQAAREVGLCIFRMAGGAALLPSSTGEASRDDRTREKMGEYDGNAE